MATDTPIDKQTPGKRRVGDGTPGPGRPKGSPNKNTRAVKEALWEAYEGVGGQEALKTWALGNPTEFYKLWGRMLPTEVSGPDGAPIRAEINDQLAAMPKGQRDALRAAVAIALQDAGPTTAERNLTRHRNGR